MGIVPGAEIPRRAASWGLAGQAAFGLWGCGSGSGHRGAAADPDDPQGAGYHASSSSDASLPPMGLRLRMKQSYDRSSFSNEARVVCDGLKHYGLIVVDSGPIETY